MHRLIYFVVLFLVSSTIANAASWTNSGSRQERAESRTEVRQNVQDARDQMIQQREELRSELREGSTEVMQRLGALHAVRLQNRFAFYFARLSDIHARLGTRLTAMETQYGETLLASARNLWEQAGAKLESAKAQGEQVVSDFQNITGDSLEAQRQAAATARRGSATTLTEFKEAVKLMKDAASAMRRVELQAGAVSSPAGREYTTPVIKNGN